MQLSSILVLLLSLVLCTLKVAMALSAITTMPSITHPERDNAIEHDSTSYIYKRREIPRDVGIAVWAFCVLVFVVAMMGLLITTQSTIGRYLSVLRGSRFFVAVSDFQHWVTHHVHSIFLKVKGFSQRMKGKYQYGNCKHLGRSHKT